MTFHWMPVPYVELAGAGPSQHALNAVLYLMVLSLTAAFVWLAALAWLERERG
jgi:hypothetical protein